MELEKPGLLWEGPDHLAWIQRKEQNASYIFKAAHEVVAHRGAGQICRVWTAAHIEEIIWAQHGVVLLGVAGGCQQAVHRYRHLCLHKGHGGIETEREREREGRNKRGNVGNLLIMHKLKSLLASTSSSTKKNSVSRGGSSGSVCIR